MSTAGAGLVLDRPVAPRRGHAARVFVTRNPTLAGGLVVLLLLALSAAAAPLWTATDPQRMSPGVRLRAPAAEHPFGTDHFGRDVFARTLYGGRISLRVGVIVALLALTAGTAIGLVSGYYRALDTVVMRVVDGLMAIPSILLALALMALVRASVETVIAALMVPEIPRVVRVVRAQVLSLRAGHAHLRLGHPGGVVPVLPRRRHPAPHPELGQHHGRGPRVRAARSVDHPVPRPVPDADGAVDQPDR
jgi:peptide/nickel transport system permease protein